MRSLAEQLPVAIRVAGSDYPIRWDWRSCLRIVTMFESTELTRAEQAELLLELLYEKAPPLCGEALQKAVLFLDGGEPGEPAKSGQGAARLYSFEKDAGLIYAAFRQSHGIDLGREQLHWWEFVSLFLSLGEDCLFCRVVALRDRKRKGQLTPTERRQAAEMDALLHLPERYSPDEQRQLEQFETLMAGR